jgi:hypothetical protein
MDTNPFKLPGKSISRHKMNILKDSAILSLKDFNRIKNSVYQPALTAGNTVSKSSSTPEIEAEIFINKALEHKNRLIDYDRRKKELDDYMKFEGHKKNERYPGVADDDEAVRVMDKMCLYARISTIRDKQLQERKEMEKMFKKKEEKLDLMVEIERLKELKNMEEKEKNLQKVSQEGKKLILAQIEDNKKARLKQKELEEKERLELLKRIEEERIKEEELNLKIKKEQEKRIQESMEANRRAIQAKKERILAEREEDLKIERYNREKYRKEEEAFQEKKRLEKEKELELQKLREKQEKVQDNQEILDSIRAKRAFDEANMKERRKQKEEYLLQQKKIKELIEANNRQKLDKEIQLAEEAKKEKEEFERIIKEHQKEIDEKKERERIKIKKLLDHNADLQRQIIEKEERNRVYKREILEEGRKDQQRRDQYIRSIEMLKRDKIKSLQDMNIDEKYIVPLKKFDLKDLSKY